MICTIDYCGPGYNRLQWDYKNGTVAAMGVCYVSKSAGQPFPDINNVWEGTFYCPQGKVKAQIRDGSGEQVLFALDGTRTWELAVQDGRRVSLRQWYESGDVKYLLEYDGQGMPHGVVKEFFEGGRIKTVGQYWHGERVGEWEWYHDDGTFARVEKYPSSEDTNRNSP